MDAYYNPFIDEKEFNSLRNTPAYIEFLKHKVHVKLDLTEQKEVVHDYIKNECMFPVYSETRSFSCNLYFYSEDDMSAFISSNLFDVTKGVG